MIFALRDIEIKCNPVGDTLGETWFLLLLKLILKEINF